MIIRKRSFPHERCVDRNAELVCQRLQFFKGSGNSDCAASEDQGSVASADEIKRAFDVEVGGGASPSAEFLTGRQRIGRADRRSLDVEVVGNVEMNRPRTPAAHQPERLRQCRAEVLHFSNSIGFLGYRLEERGHRSIVAVIVLQSAAINLGRGHLAGEYAECGVIVEGIRD